jgi:hypothetical protein
LLWLPLKRNHRATVTICNGVAQRTASSVERDRHGDACGPKLRNGSPNGRMGVVEGIVLGHHAIPMIAAMTATMTIHEMVLIPAASMSVFLPTACIIHMVGVRARRC